MQRIIIDEDDDSTRVSFINLKEDQIKFILLDIFMCHGDY